MATDVDSFNPSDPFGGILADSIANAAMGAIGGGAVGAFVGAIVPLMERAVALGQREFSTRNARGGAALLVAVNEMGNQAQDRLDAAEEHPDRLHLVASTWTAASLSRNPAKIVALGLAMSRGLLSEDSAILDHEQLYVDAMDAIERPHLALMERMHVAEDLGGGLTQIRAEAMDWAELSHAAAELRPVLARLIATLEREGLVETERITLPTEPRPGKARHVGTYWRMSDFGLHVLALFAEAGIRAAGASETESPGTAVLDGDS